MADNLWLDLSDTAPIENGRLVSEAYLGRRVGPEEEIALVARDVLRVAREERAMLEKIRTEAEGALGKTQFRVLDKILLILRGQA